MIEIKYTRKHEKRTAETALTGPSCGGDRPVPEDGRSKAGDDMNIQLNPEHAAALIGCHRTTVLRQIQNGRIRARQRTNERNQPEYLIDLTSLPVEAQRRWYAQQGEKAVTTEQLEAAARKNSGARKTAASGRRELDEYTLAEREQIAFWMRTVEEWRQFRQGPGKAAELDNDFVERLKARYPELQISKATLYRKWQAVRSNNWNSLIENRGKGRKGQSSIHPAAWEAFCAFYLRQTGPGVERCMELTEEWAMENRPEALPLPSVATFQRKIRNEISPEVLCFKREGDRRWWEEYSPYISRHYDNVVSNQIWVGDTYTLDIVTRAETGQLHRMYLSAWVDVRSGIFVGWSLSDGSRSQNSVNALRDGCVRQGTMPLNNLYTDNGREFLTFDFGGRGHRAKTVLANGEKPFQPLTIMQRMEVEMVNAIPKNSRAKIVERSFRALKDRIMRLFPTFTGGSPQEKPEQLKAILKSGRKVPTDAEAREFLDKLIQYDLNYRIYDGPVVKDRGKRLIDVYNEYSVREKIPADPAVLRLMLMRSTRPLKVGRAGIVTVINGVPMKFWREEIRQYMDQKVYIRYDPADLSSVRMYNAETDAYLMTVGRSPLEANYGEDPEKLKELLKLQRQVARAVKKEADALTAAGVDLDPVAYALDIAERNAASIVAGKNVRQTQIMYDRETEQAPPLAMAAGDPEDLDIALMNRNYMKWMEGDEYDGEDL